MAPGGVDRRRKLTPGNIISKWEKDDMQHGEESRERKKHTHFWKFPCDVCNIDTYPASGYFYISSLCVSGCLLIRASAYKVWPWILENPKRSLRALGCKFIATGDKTPGKMEFATAFNDHLPRYFVSPLCNFDAAFAACRKTLSCIHIKRGGSNSRVCA
jgi:hypothetical protein